MSASGRLFKVPGSRVYAMVSINGKSETEKKKKKKENQYCKKPYWCILNYSTWSCGSLSISIDDKISDRMLAVVVS
jgi:hypothetical protein